MFIGAKHQLFLFLLPQSLSIYLLYSPLPFLLLLSLCRYQALFDQADAPPGPGNKDLLLTPYLHSHPVVALLQSDTIPAELTEWSRVERRTSGAPATLFGSATLALESRLALITLQSFIPHCSHLLHGIMSRL